MQTKLIITLTGAVLLAGCSFTPQHVRPAGAIPEALPQGDPYRPAATDAPDVTAIGWRDFFLDPKLRVVIELGLENNRDLRIATANALQARAQYRSQRADLLPTVSTSASASFSNLPLATTGTTKSYSLDAGLSSFEIDLFGRVRSLTRAAQEQYFASQEGQRSSRITLIAEIAAAYLTLAADKDQLRISRDTLESYRQSVELTGAQFRNGVSSELELRQADTNYQSARNDIATRQTQIAQDVNALNLLVGKTLAQDMLPDGLGTKDYTLSDLPANLSSAILLRRPDVLQAEHQLIAQEANIGAARAAMFPTLSLTSTLGTLSGGLSGLFKTSSDSWTVSPTATWTLFDYGKRRANIRYYEAGRQAAVATYESTLQTAFKEVADALATRGTIDEQVSARTARANSAEVAARLSDARYRAGVDSFLTTLDSQRTAYSARQDLLTTRLARINNLIEIYRYFGGGLG